MAFRDQLAEVLLQCVSASTRESYNVADGDLFRVRGCAR